MPLSTNAGALASGSETIATQHDHGDAIAPPEPTVCTPLSDTTNVQPRSRSPPMKKRDVKGAVWRTHDDENASESRRSLDNAFAHVNA